MNPEHSDQAADAAPIDDRHKWGEGDIYNVFPIELDRAWAHSKLSRPERLVILHVRQTTWGSVGPDPDGGPSCPINVTSLSETLGIHRQQVSKALNDLTRDGLLVKTGREVRIGMDIGSWPDSRLDIYGKGYALLGEDFVPPPSDRPIKMPIPQGLRTKVFERDAYRCLRCGGYQGLSADHVVPESRGGPTTLDNLQTLCRRCNTKKHAKTIDYRVAVEGGETDAK